MNIRAVVYFILILSESLFMTLFIGRAGIYLSPVITFLFSLSIGLFPFVIKPNKSKRNYTNSFFLKILPFFTAIAGFAIVILLYRNILHNFRIDPNISDVIPTVDIMSHRLLSGEYPYQLITDYGYQIPPTYLPLQWLPFVVSSLFNFDHRWIPLGSFLIALTVFYIVVNKSKLTLIEKNLTTLLPIIILILFIQKHPKMFAQTIELLPSAFYILFCLSILSKRILVKSTGIVLPLLSRYSLILWFLPYIISLSRGKNIKRALIIVGLTIFFVLIIYIIPFVSKQPSSFTEGYKYYSKSALGEWQLKEWQNENDKPYHLFKGIGFASFYYDFCSGSIEKKLDLLRLHHLIIMLFVTLSLTILTFFYQKFNTFLLLLAGLKLYLTFFYNFIQVPYIYLNLVPVSVSLILFFFWLNHPNES